MRCEGSPSIDSRLSVMRPADATETAACWAVAIQHDGPTLFALTRQNVPHLDRSRAKNIDVAKGAYILSEADSGKPDVILIGTGSEVSLCMKAQDKLKEYGIKARVVSMPGWNLFEAQDQAYRDSILPRNIKKRVVVEAGSSYGWDRWASDEGIIIGIDHYGASAPGDQILKHFGFTAEHVTSAALRLLGRDEEASKEFGEDASGFAATAPHEGHS